MFIYARMYYESLEHYPTFSKKMGQIMFIYAGMYYESLGHYPTFSKKMGQIMFIYAGMYIVEQGEVKESRFGYIPWNKER